MAEEPTGDRPLAGRTLLLLPRYTLKGPSSRLRMGQFVPYLEAAGARVVSRPFFGDDYLDGLFGSGTRSRTSGLRAHARRYTLLRRARADAAWVERELFPFLPGVSERMLVRADIPYMADYDDAVFHRYDRHPCWAVRRGLGRKLDPLLAGSAAVTAGNRYLGDYAAAHGARRVEIVPTVVDPSHYPVVPPPAGERMRLGWIGTPDNARYLSVVGEALQRLGDRAKVTLVTIGAPELPGFPVPQERHDWSEAEEGPLLSTIDVGVMPLRDNSYERGKCGYKLIQYMAAARAVIGSPVGVNRDIVTPETGLLAYSVEDWAEAIATLAADPDRRRRMGEAGRARVEGHYSVQSVAPRLVELFAGIVR